MAGTKDCTLIDMFRATPGRSTLFTIVPLTVALVQLANSVFNDLSLFVSVPFALVMIGYGGFLTRYHFTQFRRRQLERKLSIVDVA